MAPSDAWFADQNSILDDDTLVAAYRTDLRLHQDRSATTKSTYMSHIELIPRHLADQYPNLTLPVVQPVHVKAHPLALAARAIAPTARAPRPCSHCARSTSTCAPRTWSC